MSGIAPLAGLPPAPAATKRDPRATLDQGDFLTLMTAQLKNQDPTKPVDNQQYVQQMAMFSQLAGTTETNGKLKDISERLDRLIAITAPQQE